MDDKPTSTSIEEPITSLSNEVEECEQQGEETTKEESNVVDFQAAAAESREVHAQSSMATMRDFQATFQTIHKTLNAAALKFRERTEVSWRECREVVTALQDLRKTTNDCLEFFHAGNAIPIATGYFFVTNSLYLLDGEKTARLILEVDLFESMIPIISSKDEKLSKARERIDMHVSLQSKLKEEVKYVRELIGHIEKMFEEAQAHPILPIQC